MPNYWLIKSEPNTWSWDDHVKKGVEMWDGVRNYQARNNMRAMKKGDKAFFYHSVKEKQIVGVCEVVKEFYPDPTATDGKDWSVVDFKAIETVKTPVHLDAIKQEPKLEAMILVNNSRLSVQPVKTTEWKLVCKMAGIKP